MVSFRALRPAALVVVACLVVLTLSAQNRDTGAITGTVLDEQGQPLAGAAVVIRGGEAWLRRETQTDSNGHFSAQGFQPGRYHLLFLRQGEIVWSFPVTLAPGQELLRVDIDLKKLAEAAAERSRLDPELEQRLEADQASVEHNYILQSHYSRGARLLREDKPEEAIGEYRSLVLLEPENATNYSVLGSALAAAGRNDDAEDAYRRALELEPDEAAHHNNLAALLMRRDRLEEALQHFQKAAQLDPVRAATFHFNLGAALLNAGRVEEALPALREATRSDPTLAVAHFFLGTGLFRAAEKRSSRPWSERGEERSDIVKAFQRYLQLEPDGAYARLAGDYLELLGATPPPMLLPPVSKPEEPF